MNIKTTSTLSWSLGLRLEHWLSGLVVLGLLGTVLLRKTFMSWRTNGALIQEKLAGLDLEIAPDAANAIARAIRGPMWQWHYYLGFALTALFAIRIYLFFRGENEIFTASLLRSGAGVTLKKRAYHMLHLFYYLAVAVIVATGLGLYYRESIGLSQSTVGSFKEIHEVLTLLFIVFVPLHIAGVILSECTDDPGIVSAMIHGKRTK